MSEAAQNKISQLLEKGLQHYGMGEPQKALELWQEVLNLEPSNIRANEYIKFVGGAAPAGGQDPLHMSWGEMLDEGDSGAAEAEPDPEPDSVASVNSEAEPQIEAVGEMLTSSAPMQVVSSPAPAKSDASLPRGEEAAGAGVDDAADPLRDPWDEGPSATETVNLDASGGDNEEFLETISGTHSIEDDLSPAQTSKSIDEKEGQQPPSVETDLRSLMQGALDLFELGDFSGSLDLVEKVLQTDPEFALARDYLERNQETLLQMYESKIGSFQQVPRVAIPPDEVIWLNLHHRAGFLLAQIDGSLCYEDLLALSPMSKLETCKILVQLLLEGVIQAV